VHPLVLELTARKSRGLALEGKFSVYHSAAVAIIHGARVSCSNSDDCVRDPSVIGLRSRR